MQSVNQGTLNRVPFLYVNKKSERIPPTLFIKRLVSIYKAIIYSANQPDKLHR